VSTILREESFLSHEADATAGSYYLENLVEKLSFEAWEIFLEKVSNFRS
jgi:methylmalonyl-CoA mutase N-terminal domain/subunit